MRWDIPMKPIFQKFSKNIPEARRHNTGEKGSKRLFESACLTVTTSLGSLNLVTLAVPILVEMIFNNLIGTVSTAVLSGYSEEAVAATGTVNIVLTLFAILFSSLAYILPQILEEHLCFACSHTIGLAKKFV